MELDSGAGFSQIAIASSLSVGYSGSNSATNLGFIVPPISV